MKKIMFTLIASLSFSSMVYATSQDIDSSQPALSPEITPHSIFLVVPTGSYKQGEIYSLPLLSLQDPDTPCVSADSPAIGSFFDISYESDQWSFVPKSDITIENTTLLTLPSANTYTGTTEVMSGTLNVEGSINTPPHITGVMSGCMSNFSVVGRLDNSIPIPDSTITILTPETTLNPFLHQCVDGTPLFNVVYLTPSIDLNIEDSPEDLADLNDPNIREKAYLLLQALSCEEAEG